MIGVSKEPRRRIRNRIRQFVQRGPDLGGSPALSATVSGHANPLVLASKAEDRSQKQRGSEGGCVFERLYSAAVQGRIAQEVDSEATLPESSSSSGFLRLCDSGKKRGSAATELLY